jgi:hypothetical protein
MMRTTRTIWIRWTTECPQIHLVPWVHFRKTLWTFRFSKPTFLETGC